MVGCLVLATSVQAQDLQDPSEAARYHLGPIRFTPYIVITDFGVDTNVYNENDASNPKQDTTATLGPGVNYWVKLGAGRLEARSDVTYTWFRTYADQRSFNTGNHAKLSLPMSRVTPFVDGAYTTGRSRVSYEIDSRSYSTDTLLGGGVDLRVTAKSTLRFEGHYGTVDFKQDEYFDGTNLRDALNRHFSATAFSWREALTPLTTFIVRTEYQQDRFTFSPIKDANSLRIMPGFEFAPVALIGGQVYVGYRHFETLDSRVPDYQGLVADVGANYRMRATKFDVTFKRDISYSYQETEPYYVLTDLGLKVIQKITHQWDVLGNVGRQWLGYQTVDAGGGVVAVDRLDRSYYVGGGVGYEFAEDLRVGVNANYYGRTSNAVTFNHYNGLRVGATISYGLPTK